MSEWINWSGGKCPVPVGTLLDVKNKGGMVLVGVPAMLACVHHVTGEPYVAKTPADRVWTWAHPNPDRHIIAYRICKPDAKEARRAVFQSMLDGVKTKAPEGPKRTQKHKVKL